MLTGFTTNNIKVKNQPLSGITVVHNECNGVLKISVNEITHVIEVTLYHKDLHTKPTDNSILRNIKDFIKILPMEIYAQRFGFTLGVFKGSFQTHFTNKWVCIVNCIVLLI